MSKRIYITKRISAVLLTLAMLVGMLSVMGAFPGAVAQTETVEKFTADFAGLTSGEVSTDATNVTTQYLKSKFHFWYAQEEGFLFQRPNVNDFWLNKDADGNFTEVAQGAVSANRDTAYRPDTFEAVTVSKWADYIGTDSSANKRGKSTWRISDDGMLYQDATYTYLATYRRYNQLTVLDANGTAASLKNFELTMDFKLRSESGLDTMTVAFRAATEATKTAKDVGFTDRAVVAFSPQKGYFIGGPEAENYAEHTDYDKEMGLTTMETALDTTSTYTLKLRVVGNNIETTVYNADGSVAFENTTTTTWTDEGYLVLGGSNAGAQFDNIVVTRLDDNGEAVDFTTEKFTADFRGLTAGEVSMDPTDAANAYLTDKFHFYYEEEGGAFLRPNVNDYFEKLNADGEYEQITALGSVAAKEVVYEPGTHKARTGAWNHYIAGIGASDKDAGISKWTLTDAGMLYSDANYASEAAYFHRYNQMTVLDATGEAAVLKNFELKMNFKLRAEKYDSFIVSFRAATEVGCVANSGNAGTSVDRAVFTVHPEGWFAGGPTDAYSDENVTYAKHFDRDTNVNVNLFDAALNTTDTYTLKLRVVGNSIAATIYNGDTLVATVASETVWTDEGYLIIGGSNAGAYYSNIEVTRLNDAGKAIDFNPVEKFTADFSGLNTGAVSAAADVKYLTSKFNFYYEQERAYFLRENVNDYYVDADGNPITTVQATDIDVYYPDTGVKAGSSRWVDGIGRSASSNGIATWTVDENGMLYVANSSAGTQYFRRYNQAVVLDGNGDPASLKNFKLTMDFKLSSSGKSYTTVAFRAKDEVALLKDTASADRALVSLCPNGYFIGGPTDDYEGTTYAQHFSYTSTQYIDSYTFDTSTVYTLELHVIGSKITATVYNGATVVTTFEKETKWTDAGYIVIGGSNAGGYYGNIEITRLDDSGDEVDFTPWKYNTATIKDDGTVTAKAAEGYEMRVGTLLMKDAGYSDDHAFVPEREGFQTDDQQSVTYVVPDGAVSAGYDGPYVLVGEPEFYQPTLDDPNIGNIGASYNALRNGLRFISRFTRTVDENGAWWMETGEIDYTITDYGMLLSSAPGLGTTVSDLSVTENVEKAMVLNSANQYVQKLSIKAENKYFDICDTYIDMAVTLINIDKVQGYDNPLEIEFYARPYVVVNVGGVETVLYGEYFSSNYNDINNQSTPSQENTSLKVLAIGNSFSVDGMEYLWDICRSGGYDEVVLGNLYIGGCTLDTHYTNIQENKAAYTYYKNTSGSWTTTKSYTIESALQEEEWDIITVQQASGSSGMPDTYSNLNSILEYVKTKKPDAKVMWHMTWAYQANSTHGEFSNYGSDQMQMYNAIVSTVQSQVLTKSQIEGVIPSGTAIQNLRSSYIGDTLTRDGYHLSYDLGRYTAGLTWYCALTGNAASTATYIPLNYPDLADDLAVIREAVDNATQTPYAVTASTQTAS